MTDLRAGATPGLDIRNDPIEEIARFLSELPRAKGPLIYRGQSKVDWQLRPSSYRPSTVGIESVELLERFRRQVRMHVSAASFTAIDWLVFAQHYGIATPLLDWTENPLIALYFAVGDNLQDAGELFCLERGTIQQAAEDTTAEQLFEHETVLLLPASGSFGRATAQRAVMTFHPPAMHHERHAEWEKTHVCVPRIIEPWLKPVLRDGLSMLGIDGNSVFPDLDGALRQFRGSLAAMTPRPPNYPFPIARPDN